MSTANKVLIHRWHEEVWNRKRREAIYEMLHPEAILFGLTARSPTPLRGPDQFIAFWERLIDAFPDIHISVESTLAEDDKVVARCSVRGKHTGSGLGFPGSMKSVAFDGLALAHVKQGQIYEAWNCFDFLALYQQLGVVALPTA